MDDAPSAIVKALLVSDGIFSSSMSGTWPLFRTSQPENPSNCGTLYDTQGVITGRLMGTGEVIQRHGLQLRVRAISYEDGWDKITAAADSMSGTKRETVTVGSNQYLIKNLLQTSTVIPLGHEEGSERRYEYTVNFLATISQTV